MRSLRSTRALSVLGFAALGLAVLAVPAMAQGPINPAVDTLATAAAPVIKATRMLLAIAAIVLGLIEAFKAAKGSAKDWIKAFMLWVSAGVLFNPTFLFNALGLGTLGSKLSIWGITGNAM